jgi:hypothetical protein
MPPVSGEAGESGCDSPVHEDCSRIRKDAAPENMAVYETLMLIGYARVSKADGSQVLDVQHDALLAAGVRPPLAWRHGLPRWESLRGNQGPGASLGVRQV